MPLSPIRFPVANPSLEEEERGYLQEAIDTNWISSAGPFIDRFEAGFSEAFGPGTAVAVGNGTVAIDLALKAVGVVPGDEVIVPNFTFVGSVSPIYRLQAIPVLAPTKAGEWNVDVSALEALITPKTRAIIAVHLYGVPCDIRPLVNLARRHGLKVVEDCAEALGASVAGQKVGTFGDVGCFSFFGNKVLTTGEGGMCLTRTPELADSIRLYRDHGMTRTLRYWHRVIGYNGRMTNLQAAVGLGQLERIEGMVQRRMEIQKIYEEVLKPSPFFLWPEIPAEVRSVCWLMSPVLRSDLGLDRDLLLKDLRADGIDSRPFFYPCSVMPAYARFGLDDEASTLVSSHGFNLPTYPALRDDDVREIAQRVLFHLEAQGGEAGKTVLATLPDLEKATPVEVSIVLPTYNEAEVIVDLIDALRRQMVGVHKEYEVIVVDDCSSDGTVEKVEAHFHRDGNVKVVVRRGMQRGLAASIHEGILLARGERVMVMDSDFNHDPKVTGRMARYAEDYDMVSGSRFTTGGGMQSPLRWWGSFLYNLFVRVLLLLPTQDNLSGFFCIRREILLRQPLKEIFVQDGDYFFRLIHGLHRQGATILEIPVVYADRDHGRSHKGFVKALWLYTREAMRLRWKTLTQ